MSETPSKLRQPRKLSAKIDLDALNDGRFDPTLIENLQISQPAGVEDNLVGAKKRKPQSPARIGGNSYKLGSMNGPTTTSVPRRSNLNTSQSRSSVFKPKASVFPQTAPILRKPVTSSINFGGPMNRTSVAFEDEESKAKIKLLEETVEKLSQELSEHSKHQNDLKGQLSESEQRVMNLDSFRKNLESRVTNKEQENSRFEEELQKLRKQIEREREEASAYSGRIKQELGDQVKHLQDAKEQVEHELKNCRTSLNSIEDELTSLKRTLSRQSATILDLESQIAALKAKLQTAQSEIISRSMQCDDLNNKLTEAHAVIEDLRTKLQEGKQIFVIRSFLLMFVGETIRRKLHNTVQELKGNIRVFCRIRPLMPAEIPKGSSAEDEMRHFSINRKLDDPDELSLVQPVESAIGQASTKTFPFAFDRVFGPQSTQFEVFEEISQLVQSALDGYRVCIFAYGQTGSGKTHTMEGSQSDDNLLGMIPRAVLQIFSTAQALKTDRRWEFNFEASYLEIYNESIRDLLVMNGEESSKLEIRHLPNSTKTIVTDLTVVPVESPESVLTLLKRAGHNRAVAETLCNDRSSRSHR